jgi:TetR/AcrR family tetracycline transcriptional repressor
MSTSTRPKIPTPAEVDARIDAKRFPLTAQAYRQDRLFDPDTDGCFEYGLELILAGMQVSNQN